MRLGTCGDIKFLPKNTLLKIINSLPDDTFLAVNAVGNLMVVTELGYCGFIDFVCNGKYCVKESDK